MAELAQYALLITLGCVVLALIMNLVVATSRSPVAAPATPDGDESEAVIGLEAEADQAPAPPPPAPAGAKGGVSIGAVANGLTGLAILMLTAYLVFRSIEVGHLPLVNMNGYVSALIWAILIADLMAFWRFKVRLISVIAHIVAAGLSIFVVVEEFTAGPLMPALQNSMLLTLHVAFAIAGTGVAAVSFAGAVMYLLYPNFARIKVPRQLFDEIGYKAAVIMFPLWTIMVLFGALWAERAWGSYWSWDPKETAALVSWFIYAGFLHARVVVGWRGTRSAVLLLIAFVSVLFTLFGNYFLGGLHSYA